MLTGHRRASKFSASIHAYDTCSKSSRLARVASGGWRLAALHRLQPSRTGGQVDRFGGRRGTRTGRTGLAGLAGLAGQTGASQRGREAACVR